MRIQRYALTDDAVDLEFSDQQTARISLFWFRDHSTDRDSLHPETLQREVVTFALPVNPGVIDHHLTEGGETLHIRWQDGAVSHYPAVWLHRLAVGSLEPSCQQFWRSDFQSVLPGFDFHEIVNSEDSFRSLLESIERFGVVTLSEMPSDMQATRQLLERLGYIRETVFGGLWNFSNNAAHSDSAYTSAGIGLHTDGTYTLDPPGLQLLHCLVFNGEGGVNQFVDGFAVAEAIRERDSQAYRTLTSTQVPAHYLEPGIQLRAEHPVIAENRKGDVEQICFNNYDRSPMLLAMAEQREFYRAYGLFASLINDPDFQVQVELRPGRAVWFDNWRVLHARTAFTGFRHMAGGYSNREDYLSRLATLRGQTPWS